eukprot:778834_1
MALKRIIAMNSALIRINHNHISKLQSINNMSPMRYICKRLYTDKETLDFDPTQPTTFTNRYKLRDSEGRVKLMVGDHTTYDKTFTAHDIQKYSRLTGNFNPLHDTGDSSAARRAGFEGSIIHGMFTSSIFSAAIGAHFPGAIVFEIYSRWTKPIYIGESLFGFVTVKKIMARKKTCCL